MKVDLKDYGLDNRILKDSEEYSDLYLGRISEQHRGLYRIIGVNGEYDGVLSGKMLHNFIDQIELPSVGDWVMTDRIDDSGGNAIIHELIERKSVFVREAAGTSGEKQIVASNIDTIFICMSLNDDFNLRRVERYLTIAWESMARPVIVLTKKDLCENLYEKLNEIEEVSIGVDVVAVSVDRQGDYRDINQFIDYGKTIAFIGSSGVGKSTLINRLMGEEIMDTSDIRNDDSRGRHTTTYRQLLVLPQGGVVIDTPGMRELKIYTGDRSKAFEDIEKLSKGCKFGDCKHESEPECMVKAAIEDGRLSQERFNSYLKLEREMAYEGLKARQKEKEKIDRMFGSKNRMKETKRNIKKRK